MAKKKSLFVSWVSIQLSGGHVMGWAPELAESNCLTLSAHTGRGELFARAGDPFLPYAKTRGTVRNVVLHAWLATAA